MGGHLSTQEARDLSRLRFGDTDLLSILEIVVRVARERIPNADEVTVTIKGEQRLYTAVATDERVKRADDLQYSLDEGPCVDAMKTGDTFEVRSMASEDRWPRYSPAALELGVHSSIGIPLMAEGGTVGALNVFAWSDDAFTDEDRRVAREIAEQVDVVLANAVAFHEKTLLADQLQQAVETRETIGKAVGILMEREGINDEQAFAMLRTASQNSNLKLRDLAAELVARTLDSTARGDRRG